MTNSLRLEICGGNFTEGAVKPQVRAADVVVGQEINRTKVRAGMPLRGHWFPPQDPHQSISWRRSVFHVTGKGYERFHRSGQAEGWPFKSPARGLIWVAGHLVKDPGVKVVLAGLWFLNSWGKGNAEGPARRRIVEERSIPVVERMLEQWHDEGRTVILQGDANNIHWDGRLPGMTQVKTHGLDRAWITTGGALRLIGNPREGPTTGVGNDMRHHAVLFTLATKEN